MFTLNKLRSAYSLAQCGHYHVYIQIPFCRSRCPFCCFVAGLQNEELTDLSLIPAYLDALIFEIQCCELPALPLKSIVLGGGTPALLSGSQASRLINAVYNRVSSDLAPDLLTSFETTPELASEGKLREFHDAGFTRVSIGVQSFLEEDLRLLGRRNSPEDAHAAFRHARDAGFQRVNIDLLGGFPGGTFEKWSQNLRTAFELSPEFITTNMMAYAYTGADNYIRTLADRGYSIPSYEERVQMYHYAFEALEAHGYEPVDFVVFSRENHRFDYEVHGLGLADNVVAFGAWALSALPDCIYIGLPFIREYIRQPLFKKVPSRYRDNIYQIIHGRLIGCGRVCRSELEPLLRCSFEEAVKQNPNASGLLEQLLERGLAAWNEEGLELEEQRIPEAIVFLWDYQKTAGMMA